MVLCIAVLLHWSTLFFIFFIHGLIAMDVVASHFVSASTQGTTLITSLSLCNKYNSINDDER